MLIMDEKINFALKQALEEPIITLQINYFIFSYVFIWLLIIYYYLC